MQKYTEQLYYNSDHGWIEVIVGSMFSGKTEELLRRIRRAQLANLRIGMFKPEIDKRYSKNDVVSHDNNFTHSITINKPEELLDYQDKCQVFGIDEVQFLEKSIINVCNTLADNGKRVIVAGLDMDFEANPFNPMPELMAVAEFVTKLHAICMKCGKLANYSHRTTADKEKIVLGEKNNYEALCRNCYNQTIKA